MNKTVATGYLFAVILALLVSSLGALTRLTDSGLGCPDWPGCYGKWIAPHSEKALQHAQTEVPTNEKHLKPFHAWMEMVHRYVAGLLVLAITGLFIHQLKYQPLKNPWPLYLLGMIIILQAVLGMLTVTMTLRPWVVSLHLLGGLSSVSLLWYCYLNATSQSAAKYSNKQWPFALAILLTMVQIALGAWTSTHYAALACASLPFCQLPLIHWFDAWIHFKPTMQSDFMALSPLIKMAIQQWHRIGATVVGTYLITLSGYCLIIYRANRTIALVSCLLFVLTLLQIALGMGIVLMARPLHIAWAHHAIATVLLLATITLYHHVKKQ